MKEIIVDIIGYEDAYSISNYGYIISKTTNSKLASRTQNSGYQLVHLHKSGSKKAFTVHRLVALHFCPNPEAKPFVNHLDGNKSNNRSTNLSWVTGKENMRHAFDSGLMDSTIPIKIANGKKLGSTYGGKYCAHIHAKNEISRTPVAMIDSDGNIIKSFQSINDASRAGYFNVGRVLKGQNATCGGYKWIQLSKS